MIRHRKEDHFHRKKDNRHRKEDNFQRKEDNPDRNFHRKEDNPHRKKDKPHRKKGNPHRKKDNPHRKKDNARHKTQAPVGPIERFFKSFSNFPYDPSKPSAQEYQRLNRSNGWKRGDSKGEEACLGFQLALVKDFNWWFGTDPNDLLAWQTLCKTIGIRERLETCDDCVQYLHNRHFNIIDVVDARRRGDGIAQVFPTKGLLQEYTKRTASHFPYDSPKAGYLLSRLVRQPRRYYIRSLNKSIPRSYLQDGRYEANKKDSQTISNGAETQSAKRQQVITESLEATNDYAYIEFESE
ncbi:MAG: hypothetical protein HETSPECPRED_007451 [Heterodermia speciosa]|uniref:Uncharacterized protein n=1 Tax=Heterodermia speciosa TaxID=116794 RepID=A0A8H3FS61_9LECA|nr:MAG: hypothetical protein HETSPECPRED_007451 [Heterodermia speciosa]